MIGVLHTPRLVRGVTGDFRAIPVWNTQTLRKGGYRRSSLTKAVVSKAQCGAEKASEAGSHECLMSPCQPRRPASVGWARVVKAIDPAGFCADVLIRRAFPVRKLTEFMSSEAPIELLTQRDTSVGSNYAMQSRWLYLYVFPKLSKYPRAPVAPDCHPAAQDRRGKYPVGVPPSSASSATSGSAGSFSFSGPVASFSLALQARRD
ncbi:hypothetical protein C8R45DRAFT_941026 [Mycena sanguinolenta]|nr:hypothetical protein C8R45DRAFT_941026 [Mycena sanguinolenta]